MQGAAAARTVNLNLNLGGGRSVSGGINTDAEPSAADVGRIIKQIRREKIPAVFIESFTDPRLLERIRLESGARIGGALYSDSLSKAGGPASSYLDMMRHNAKTLATALSN